LYESCTDPAITEALICNEAAGDGQLIRPDKA